MLNYLNQDLVLKTPNTPNEFNESGYSESNIKGRLELGYNLISDSKGEQVVSIACLFTQTPINVNCMIGTYTIIRVDPLIDLDGTIHHYEVYLR